MAIRRTTAAASERKKAAMSALVFLVAASLLIASLRIICRSFRLVGPLGLRRRYSGRSLR